MQGKRTLSLGLTVALGLALILQPHLSRADESGVEVLNFHWVGPIVVAGTAPDFFVVAELLSPRTGMRVGTLEVRTSTFDLVFDSDGVTVIGATNEGQSTYHLPGGTITTNFTAYQRLRDGQPATFPPPSFGDFVNLSVTEGQGTGTGRFRGTSVRERRGGYNFIVGDPFIGPVDASVDVAIELIVRRPEAGDDD